MPANRKPRKPYRPKPVARSTVTAALLAATKLTDVERDSIIAPSRQFLIDAQESGMTEKAYLDLQVSMHAGLGIENSGIITGLRAEFEAGIEALDEIVDMCLVDVIWIPSVPTCGQIATLENALDMHDFQLQQLAASEYQRIIRRLINQTTDATRKMKKASK